MKLLSVAFLGMLLYFGLHLGVLRKPLTIGYIKDAYEFKLGYARQLGAARKIVVVGGSSSLFGVRCQTIAAETGLPCVNMAVTAGLGVDLVLAKVEDVIRPGDVVLLPLEYDFYGAGAEGLRNNATANTYLATYDRALLMRQDWRRLTAALLTLSLQDAYSSVVEMGLQTAGFQRRFTLSQLTAQGDMTGHSPERGAEYAGYVASMPVVAPMAGSAVEDSEGMRLITAFIARHKERGVHVYGANPTTIDDGSPPAPGFEAVERVWRQAGAGFLALPNLGRYPRSFFYDTVNHLAEPFQIEHSRALARRLKAAEGI
jgi:hypothetical protein